MESIKVAVLGDPFPSDLDVASGGPRAVISQLARHRWSSDGIDLRIMAPKKRRAVTDISERVIRIRSWELLNSLTKFRPDVVNVHGVSELNLVGSVISRVRKPDSIVLTVHGLAIDEIGTRQWAHAWHPLYEWVEFAVAPWLTTVSEAFVSSIARTYDLAHKQVRIVPNGVDDFWFNPSHSPSGVLPIDIDVPFVLYVGEASFNKGIDLLVHAIPHLPAGVQVVLVTKPNTWLDSLLREAQLSGTANRITTLHSLPKTTLRALYGRAGAVALPSRTDSFPLVALEALASGAPLVLSASVGPAHELAANDCAVVSEENTAGSMAWAINEILESPARARSLSAAGVVFARHYTWEKVAERYAMLYREVASANLLPSRDAETIVIK